MINFDEATHTYSRNGNTYTSVTTLLKKYNLSPSYSNIPSDVLLKAATRGHNTHKALENYIKTGVYDDTNIDLVNFNKYITARNIDLTTSQSEAVVYDDNYLIAGTIDWQYVDNGEEVIADFKTTSQIHWDAVAWQLSIYTYMQCKGDILQYYMKHLKVIHIYNGKLSVRDLPTIDYDEVVKLLIANMTNSPYVYTPDLSNIMSHSESVMLHAILTDIEQCETLLKDLYEKKDVVQKKLQEKMESTNQHEALINNIYLKYTDSSTRKSLDTAKVKILCDKIGFDMDTLYKVSTIKPKLTITKKGEGY